MVNPLVESKSLEMRKKRTYNIEKFVPSKKLTFTCDSSIKDLDRRMQEEMGAEF